VAWTAASAVVVPTGRPPADVSKPNPHCGSVTDEEEQDMSEEFGSLVYDSAIEI